MFGQYLYANVEENIVRVDLEANEPQEEVLVKNAGGVIDGNHIYYVDYESWHLYRCDMDGSNPVLIVEKPVLLASMNLRTTIFISDCTRVWNWMRVRTAMISTVSPRRIPHKLKKLQRYQHRHIKFIQFLDMTKFL